MGRHVYCSECNANKVKKEIAKESDMWTKENRKWTCPYCNEYGSDED